MIQESSPQDLTFWLQEARQLMISAERCWKADETIKTEITEGRIQLGVENMQTHIDAEMELNWLYNLLATLSLYYIAVGILIHRDQERFLNDMPTQNVSELITECGVDLGPEQKRFLERAQTALFLAEDQQPWKIALNPEQLRIMNQAFGENETVSARDKQAVDALFARLIVVALDAVGSEQT